MGGEQLGARQERAERSFGACGAFAMSSVQQSTRMMTAAGQEEGMVDPDLDQGREAGGSIFFREGFLGKNQSNVVYCLPLRHVSNTAPHVIVEVRMLKETDQCFLQKIRSRISGKWQKNVNGYFLQKGVNVVPLRYPIHTVKLAHHRRKQAHE